MPIWARGLARIWRQPPKLQAKGSNPFVLVFIFRTIQWGTDLAQKSYNLRCRGNEAAYQQLRKTGIDACQVT